MTIAVIKIDARSPTLHMPAAMKIPLAIDHRRKARSIGSLTALRRRMIARAPTTPTEAIAFWCIIRIRAAVTGPDASSERL